MSEKVCPLENVLEDIFAYIRKSSPARQDILSALEQDALLSNNSAVPFLCLPIAPRTEFRTNLTSVFNKSSKSGKSSCNYSIK